MKSVRPPHIDARGLCGRFGISRRTLTNWQADKLMGFPQPFKINRRLYWRSSEIEAWEVSRGAPAVEDDSPFIGRTKILSKNIRTYDGLVDLLVKRRKALKFSCAEIDARAGMQEGYTNKLENPRRPYGRSAGGPMLDLWLGALEVAIIVVEHPRDLAGLRERSRGMLAGLDHETAA